MCDLVTGMTEAGATCAWCDAPLPAPIEALPVVHGRDGIVMTACGTLCLAGLVAALAGRIERHRPPVAGGMK